MDRIDRLTLDLMGHQCALDSSTVVGDQDAMENIKARRDALRNEIAADFRAMVAALEKYEMAEQYADEHGVAAVTTIELLTEAYEAGHAILARVKGES